jgi:glycosyltransferase involved in cell wall biosynthesis
MPCLFASRANRIWPQGGSRHVRYLSGRRIETANGRDPSVRVLHIAGALNGRMGGPSQSIIADCLAIRDRGWACVVAAPKADDEESETIRARLLDAGVQIVEFDLDLRGRAAMWGISRGFMTWLVRHVPDFDVVHTHGVWFLPDFAGLAIARVMRVPAVTSPHESLTKFNARDTRATWMRSVKTLLRPIHDWLTQGVVFSSELELADSWHRRLRNKSHVVYHALAADKFIERAHPRRAADDLRIGYIGRLDRKKNVGLLIKAVAAMPANVRLVVAGAGDSEHEAELRSMAARLAVQDRVSWRGFLSSGEHPGFFDDVDVVAMPSAFECFGRAAAEAMAAGVPVVVGTRTGIAEVIGRHGGGRCVATDATQLRDALMEVLSMSAADRDLLGAHARSAALTELTIQAHGASLERVYQGAIARRR